MRCRYVDCPFTCDGDGQPVAVDVALPAGMPVAALLPAIVGLAGQPSSDTPRGWRLDRIGGPTLDESNTLVDNDVHDGDVLVLAPSNAPTLGLLQWDPCQTVAAAGLPPEVGSVRSAVACVWAAVVGSLALCWGAAAQTTTHLLVAAIGTCTAAGFAIVGRSAATGLASVPLAAAAGFLAVPSGPGAANVFLAAVAAATMSLLMLHWTGDGSSPLRGNGGVLHTGCRRHGRAGGLPRPHRRPLVPQWRWPPSGCWRYPAASRFCCPGWPPIGSPTTPTHVRSAATPP